MKSIGQDNYIIVHFYGKDLINPVNYKLIIDQSQQESDKAKSKFYNSTEYNFHISYDSTYYYNLIYELENHKFFRFTNENFSSNNFIRFSIYSQNKLVENYSRPILTDKLYSLFQIIYEIDTGNTSGFINHFITETKYEREYESWEENFRFCSEFVVTFSFSEYNINVHELTIATIDFMIDTVVVIDSTSFIMVNSASFPRCDYVDLWNLPFSSQLNKKEFEVLDSILYNKTLPFIKTKEEKSKNKKISYLEFYLYSDNKEFNKYQYSRFIEIDSEFFNIFEMAYLIDSLEKSTFSNYNSEWWILTYLSWGLSINEEKLIEKYKIWKSNKK